jgi:integrase/recombinase XerD
MTATTTSTVLVPVQPVFTDAERLALAGYLAGYRGQTRDAYALDLRQFTTWCRTRSLPPPAVRRRHRTVRPRPGITRPGPRDRHPQAVPDRRVLPVRGRGRTPGPFPGRARPPPPPGLRIARRRTGPQRTRRSPGRRRTRAAHRACADLAARLNGLRVSEATGADIEQLGLERGHWTLVITRKGGKVVTIPLAPRTARAIDLAIGERVEGPVFLASDGRRLDRHGASRIVRRVARRAGSARRSGRARCGTRSSPQPSTPGYRCVMCRKPPPTPIRGPRCGTTGPGQPGSARHLHRRRLPRRGSPVTRHGQRPGRAQPGPSPGSEHPAPRMTPTYAMCRRADRRSG